MGSISRIQLCQTMFVAFVWGTFYDSNPLRARQASRGIQPIIHRAATTSMRRRIDGTYSGIGRGGPSSGCLPVWVSFAASSCAIGG
jgi:hypothetical protein